MISQQPRDKEGDLVTQESEEEPKTIDLTIKAEGIIASAFYLLKANYKTSLEAVWSKPKEVTSKLSS